MGHQTADGPQTPTGDRKRRGISLVFLYALFAGVAIAVNLGTQRLVVWLWELLAPRLGLPVQWEFLLALLAGTGTGLLVKYALDKRFIFAFVTRSARHNVKTFVLYSLMGVVTTAVFWGFEFAFEHLFAFAGARYVGGFLGLLIGYTSKYLLDRRFVFRAAG